MVDTPGLGPGAFGCEGSSPFSGTKHTRANKHYKQVLTAQLLEPQLHSAEHI